MLNRIKKPVSGLFSDLFGLLLCGFSDKTHVGLTVAGPFPPKVMWVYSVWDTGFYLVV